MHYANGREAKVGDLVVGKDIAGNPVAGRVLELIPGSDTCNVRVMCAAKLYDLPMYTASDLIHLEDVGAFQPVSEQEAKSPEPVNAEAAPTTSDPPITPS